MRRMPMSEEDEVFLERSFQRTLIVRIFGAILATSHLMFPLHTRAMLTLKEYLGARKAHLLLGNTYRSMAADRRGLLCQSRVLRVGWAEQGGTSEEENLRVSDVCEVVVSRRFCLFSHRANLCK